MTPKEDVMTMLDIYMVWASVVHTLRFRIMQSTIWSSPEERPKRHSRRSDQRPLASQILRVEPLQKLAVSKSAGMVPDEYERDVYSMFTYNQLIDHCKQKDADIHRMKFEIKSMKSDLIRLTMAGKHGGEGYAREKLKTRLAKGDFSVNMLSNVPLRNMGVCMDSVFLKLAWKPRRVVLLYFDVVDRTFLVGTPMAVWRLHDAYERFGQSNENIGQELFLHAQCFLSHTGNKPDCHFLSYSDASFVERGASEIDGVNDMVAAVVVCKGEVFLTLGKKSEFVDFKCLLKSYLCAIATFEKFAPAHQRKMDMARISILKQKLLDREILRLEKWAYKDLLKVWEWQDWKPDLNPFSTDDIELLENLTQEGELTRKLLVEMARHEMERRDHCIDDTISDWEREQWMFPACYVSVPKRPWEVISANDQSLDTNVLTNVEVIDHLVREMLVYEGQEATHDTYMLQKDTDVQGLTLHRMVRVYCVADKSTVALTRQARKTVSASKWVDIKHELFKQMEDGQHKHWCLPNFAPMKEWKRLFAEVGKGIASGTFGRGHDWKRRSVSLPALRQ